MKELEQIDFDDVAGSGLTKKELLVLRREKEKLELVLTGIRDMQKIPSAIWVVDTNKEHLAVQEAHKLGIAVVGILDTNCDPDVVDYPIPGNDDALRAVGLLTSVITDAIAEGLIARAGGNAPSADAAVEPLAEWEKELLEGAPVAETTEVVSETTVETPAEVVAAEVAVEAVAEEAPVETAAEVAVEAVAEEAPVADATEAPAE